jgi:hypothetical protein
MKPLTYDEFKRLDVNHIAHDAQRNNRVENLEVITKKSQFTACTNQRNSQIERQGAIQTDFGQAKG